MKNLIFIFFLFQSLILFSQVKSNDTLYFNLNQKYVKKFEQFPNRYYINEKGSEGSFYFEILGEIKLSIPNKVNCLKNYIRKKEIYKKNRIISKRLYEEFQKFTVIFVQNFCGEIKLIKVRAGFELE